MVLVLVGLPLYALLKARRERRGLIDEPVEMTPEVMGGLVRSVIAAVGPSGDGWPAIPATPVGLQEALMMRAWMVDRPGPIPTGPLRAVARPVPDPAPDEVRVRVTACGVCRTDLHLAEGDLAPRRHGVVPGHEVVGHVDAVGDACTRVRLGERVGVAWLRRTCASCRWCRAGAENLCTTPRFTGWDDDGGYAEYAVVPEDYAYRLPERFGDVEAAPLLCAGIIGYRALRRAELPAGGHLGIYGFGASAHLAAQVAMARGARVHVLTRSASARALARDLGVASVGDADASPPVELDAAILFAPAGTLVPVALRALTRGGTLAIAGIHLSQIPPLDYDRDLFHERQIRSVTANTRRDGEEFLALAAEHRIRVHTEPYSLADADRALADLAADRVTGAAVLVP
jgi:propanol-preferring alcohol dehydrogenase